MYMTLQQEYREKYNEGLEAGIEQGIERGIEQGIERGIEQGIERGIEQGIERGIEQGLERGIKILYCDIHMTIPEIAAKMSITEQQVEKIVEKFGKKEEK